jgi:hypothetical protein
MMQATLENFTELIRNALNGICQATTLGITGYSMIFDLVLVCILSWMSVIL